MAYDWFVLKLRPGHDALGLRSLDKLSIPYAYPTVTERRPRKTSTVTPIFPGYALVYFDPARPLPAIDHDGCKWLSWPLLAMLPGVVGVIHDGATPLPVRDYVIQDVIQSDGLETLRPGATVQINVGPFTSFMAKVKSYDEALDKYHIEAQIFNRKSCLTVARDDVSEVA
jgi:transcription antitermination factor NusG